MAVTFLNTAVLQNIGRARHGECATPTDFYDVWRCVKAFHVAEEHSALEGVTLQTCVGRISQRVCKA